MDKVNEKRSLCQRPDHRIPTAPNIGQPAKRMDKEPGYHVHKQLRWYTKDERCLPDRKDVALYFGAGWESSVLNCKCIRHFVFVDGMPNSQYWPKGCNGWAKAKTPEMFLGEVERNFPMKFESKEIARNGNLLKYTFSDKRTLHYYINTPVQAFIDSEYGNREMKFVTLVYIRGFFPFGKKHGFDHKIHTPNVKNMQLCDSIYEKVLKEESWMEVYLKKGTKEVRDDITQQWRVYFEDYPRIAGWSEQKEKAQERAIIHLRGYFRNKHLQGL